MPDIEPDEQITEGAEADAGQEQVETPTGDEGEKDWKAEYEAQQRINRQLERKNKKDFARIQELEKSGTPAAPKGDEPVDPAAIRAEIEAELRTGNNTRLVNAEAKAALAGKVHNPRTALKLLDLSKVEVDANGDVDDQALSDAIAELLEDEPYLAVAQGAPQQRFQGNADQGPRGESKSAEQQLRDELKEATEARDFTRAIGLKQRLAALANTK